MTDVISDMLTRIRNAGRNKFETVNVPTSKMKVEIAKILKEEGYITDFKEEADKEVKHKTLKLTLKYVGGKSAILGLKRISTPGLRVYAEALNIPKVLNGLGIAILSTNKGVVTDSIARKLNVGGEVLAYIW